MTIPGSQSTLSLSDLFTTPTELREYIQHLDRSMLYMVLHLKYEPELLDEVIKSYESLYFLQQALENEQTKK